MINRVIVDSEFPEADLFGLGSPVGLDRFVVKLKEMDWAEYRITIIDTRISEVILFPKVNLTILKYPVKVEGKSYLRWDANIRPGSFCNKEFQLYPSPDINILQNGQV